MSIGSPIWLLALLPWGMLALYLRQRRGSASIVPFLKLWPARQNLSQRSGSRWPSLPTLLVLASLAFVVMAAAQPRLVWLATPVSEVSIVLDRGATMSLASTSSQPYRGAIARAEAISPQSVVTLVPVPGEPIITTAAAWAATAAALPPTALTVHLDATVARLLRETPGPVVVLSNQTLALADPRIVQIAPDPAAGTIAITTIAAMRSPQPQVMLRLENHSDRPSVRLRLQSGPNALQRVITLCKKGNTENVFIDLPATGPTIIATLIGESGPWSCAQLVSQSTGLRAAADADVDPSVRRIAEIYNRSRLIPHGSNIAWVANHPLDSDQSGIWISSAADSGGITNHAQAIPHAITAHVHTWPSAGTALLPDGFSPVVSDGKRVIVAARNSAHRQVWLNADLSEWEKTADFVVFFADALNWISADDQTYSSVAPATLGPDWHPVTGSAIPPGLLPGQWPGIYQSDRGQLLAVNAGAFPPVDEIGNRSPGSIPPAIKLADHPIGGMILLAALAGLTTAAALWPRQASFPQSSR